MINLTGRKLKKFEPISEEVPLEQAPFPLLNPSILPDASILIQHALESDDPQAEIEKFEEAYYKERPPSNLPAGNLPKKKK